MNEIYKTLSTDILLNWIFKRCFSAKVSGSIILATEKHWIKYGASSIICIPDNHCRDREREIERKRFQLKEIFAFEVVYFIEKFIILKKPNIFKQYRAARTHGLMFQFFSNCRKKYIESHPCERDEDRERKASV